MTPALLLAVKTAMLFKQFHARLLGRDVRVNVHNTDISLAGEQLSLSPLRTYCIINATYSQHAGVATALMNAYSGWNIPDTAIRIWRCA